jgi:hypothetical protein
LQASHYEEVNDRLSETLSRTATEAISYKLNEVGILTHLGKLKRLCRRQTFSSIVRDGLVNNGTTVHAFPRIEHQKEIRESLHPHQALAFGTLHRAPRSG